MSVNETRDLINKLVEIQNKSKYNGFSPVLVKALENARDAFVKLQKMDEEIKEIKNSKSNPELKERMLKNYKKKREVLVNQLDRLFKEATENSDFDPDFLLGYIDDSGWERYNIPRNK